MKTAILALTTGILLQLDTHLAAADDYPSTSANRPVIEPIGYIWPKQDLLIPDATKGQFKKLQISQRYDLLKQIDSGYLIPLEHTDGSLGIALIPFRDRMGNRTANPYEPPITFVNIDGVTIRPGFIPLETGKKYAVASKDKGNYSVFFCCTAFTQTVTVAETNFSFVSSADYTGVIKALTSSAERLIATNASLEYVAAVFTNYSGKFAAETASEREELARKYVTQAARDRYLQFEADQRAKGLVKDYGEWVTQEESTKRELFRQADREQATATVQQAPVVRQEEYKFTATVVQALRDGVLANASFFKTVTRQYKEPDQVVSQNLGLNGRGGMTITKPGQTNTVDEDQCVYRGLVFIRGINQAVDDQTWRGTAYVSGAYEYTTTLGAFKRVREFTATSAR